MSSSILLMHLSVALCEVVNTRALEVFGLGWKEELRDCVFALDLYFWREQAITDGDIRDYMFTIKFM